MMEGPGADSEEKHEPVSDIDTAVVVVGLKALDPEWPIREAFGGKRTFLRMLKPRRATETSPCSHSWCSFALLDKTRAYDGY